jgi:serine protease inhibitor
MKVDFPIYLGIVSILLPSLPFWNANWFLRDIQKIFFPFLFKVFHIFSDFKKMMFRRRRDSDKTQKRIEEKEKQPEIIDIVELQNRVDILAVSHFNFKLQKLTVCPFPVSIKNSLISPLSLRAAMVLFWEILAVEKVPKKNFVHILLNDKNANGINAKMYWDKLLVPLFSAIVSKDHGAAGNYLIYKGAPMELRDKLKKTFQNWKFLEPIFVHDTKGLLRIIDEINNNVARNTNNKIVNFLESASQLDGAQGVIFVNYLFLDALFENPFEEKYTEQSPFYRQLPLASSSGAVAQGNIIDVSLPSSSSSQKSIQEESSKIMVKMLHHPETDAYYRKLEQVIEVKDAMDQSKNRSLKLSFEILEMTNKEPYDSFRLGFILPLDPGMCEFFGPFTRNGAVSFYAKLMDSASKRKVKISIPEFSLHYKYKKLVPFIKYVFNTSLTPAEESGKQLGEVVQEVFLQVYAKGAKAGTSSSATMPVTSPAPGYRDEIPFFNANRPFVVYLRHVPTNQIVIQGLFTGVPSVKQASAMSDGIQDESSFVTSVSSSMSQPKPKATTGKTGPSSKEKIESKETKRRGILFRR